MKSFFRMAHLASDLVCPPQPQVMHRILIECFDAKWAAERDHSRAGFDVTQSAAVIDGFAADNAQMVPVCNVRIF